MSGVEAYCIIAVKFRHSIVSRMGKSRPLGVQLIYKQYDFKSTFAYCGCRKIGPKFIVKSINNNNKAF